MLNLQQGTPNMYHTGEQGVHGVHYSDHITIYLYIIILCSGDSISTWHSDIQSEYRLFATQNVHKLYISLLQNWLIN